MLDNAVKFTDEGRVTLSVDLLATSTPQSDGVMPEMDGICAVRAIRANGYKGPIIAVSAHAMKGTREECLNVGFTDFLAKPVDRTDLLRTLADRLTV